MTDGDKARPSSNASSLQDIRSARIRKLRELRGLGLSPYSARCHRTHSARELQDGFEMHHGQCVTVAGRLMSWRPQGAITFGHIQDPSDRIQLYLRRDSMRTTDPSAGRLGYEHLRLLDVGDFLQASGTLTKTSRGEVSILVDDLVLLTKSLRPLPDKWHGLRDRESILRRRYLHTTMAPEERVPFEKIAAMLYEIRLFLNQRGFMEFHTPVLQARYGGGTARPFTTHINALDCEMYLAISHELYLKRLIAAGFEQVYTIGRFFRNEGIDRTHHPEFSMLETMTAYQGYEYNMDLLEELLRHIALSVFHKTTFRVGEHEVDFRPPWRRVSMVDAVLDATGIDFRTAGTVSDANSALASLGVLEEVPTVGHALARAFEQFVEPTLVQPSLVYGHPVEISPLAKPMSDDPRYAERFEVFIAGLECGDNWSEQNDPLALLEAWKTRHRGVGEAEDEAPPVDYDFIEVLEHGIPPTTGLGPGMERMAMIFCERENIDDVIFFPLLRPQASEANLAIYGVEARPPPRHEETLLSVKEFELLLDEGILRPETPSLTIRPVLRLWSRPTRRNHWRASGHLTIDGFLRGGQLRVVGYTVSSEDSLDPGRAAASLVDIVHASIVEALRGTTGGISVTVEDVEVVSDP